MAKSMEINTALDMGVTSFSTPLSQQVLKGYDIVRKNTFIEVVSREGSRPRARSEPAWSRETTPTRKPLDFMEDRSTDTGSSHGSPAGTPTLNTRGLLNSQPAMWQPQAFFWQPYPNEGESMGEWNGQSMPFDESNMYNGNYQWMQYGNNMQGNNYGEDGQYMMMDDMHINGPNGEQMQNGQWMHGDGSQGARPVSWDGRRDRMERERMDRMDTRGMHAANKRKPRAQGKNGGGSKVFVGGLASKTTEETLMKVFCQYGNVVHASVLVDATSRRSRGFGYVTFQGDVPESVTDKDHLIDGRMCGARLYKYN